MAGQEFTLQAQVEIDGSPLAPDLVPSLERVVVDDHLHLPDTFVLVVPGPRPKGPFAREDQDRIAGQGRGHAVGRQAAGAAAVR